TRAGSSRVGALPSAGVVSDRLGSDDRAGSSSALTTGLTGVGMASAPSSSGIIPRALWGRARHRSTTSRLAPGNSDARLAHMNAGVAVWLTCASATPVVPHASSASSPCVPETASNDRYPDRPWVMRDCAREATDMWCLGE